ncbi:sensor histidine kinase [Cellulophaga sp. Z1A5H]|uniref:sensor histidine kinase n=1 Tax=Cellulophaga sp. Z1A5H TaxID=2687291 RepID=UPI0013FD7193|nr:histidine kinase [Cellulophaga sp. Z1A5H]
MGLKNNHSEIIFWLLQLIGWSMINAMIFIIPELSNQYKVYSFITATFGSIIVTSFFRLFLKNKIDFNNFRASSIYEILTSLVFCAGIYYGLFILLENIYELFWKRTPEEILWLLDNYSHLSTLLSAFFTILVWAVIYILVKFVLTTNKNRLENLELNATLREAQLNTLKGQVNPHFMFNSLNNIRGLMLEDVSKSREMITKLSEMLQYALSKNTVDAIALSEEVDMVDNYVALAKIQMEDRLHYEKEIDAESLEVMIPPMIIQLLVENAAKHGIANLKNGGKILLQTIVTATELQIVVKNTGKLSISENSTKLGLKNIRQRLRLLYGPKGQFTLEEIENEVVATIKIPTT